MKKAIGIFILCALVSLSLSSCGSNTESEKTEASAAVSANVETASNDINGFDSSTNQSVEFGNFVFPLPSYYVKDDSYKDGLHYYTDNNDGVSIIFAESKELQKSDLDSYISEFLSDNSGADVSDRETEIANHPAHLVSTKSDTNTSMTCALIYDESKNKAVMVSLFEDVGNEYSYVDDFNRTLQGTTYTEQATSSENGIRPEFKEAMDSYEAFFDEYVVFMEKFSQDSSNLSLISEYANYMTKYTEAMQKLDEIKNGEMSSEELSYYTQTMARITQKLATVSYS